MSSFKTRDTDAETLRTHPIGSFNHWSADDERRYREVQRAADLAMTSAAPTPAPPTAPTAPTTKGHASAVLLPENFRRDKDGIFLARPDSPTKELVDKLMEEKRWAALLAPGTREWNERCARQRAASGQCASSMLLRNKRGQ